MRGSFLKSGGFMLKDKKQRKIQFLIKNGYSENVIEFASAGNLNYDKNYRAMIWVAREYAKIINSESDVQYFKDNVNIVLNWINIYPITHLAKMDFTYALQSAIIWEEEYYNIEVADYHELSDENSYDIINLALSKKLEFEEEYIVFSYNGYHIVKVDTDEKIYREGYQMRHCLTPQYLNQFEKNEIKLYSLRDIYNNPYITFTLINTGEQLSLQEISGIESSYPNNEYLKIVIKWFDNIVNMEFIRNVMNIDVLNYSLIKNIIINHNHYFYNYHRILKFRSLHDSVNILLYDVTKLYGQYSLKPEIFEKGEQLIVLNRLEQFSRWLLGRDELMFSNIEKCKIFEELLNFLEYRKGLESHPALLF